MRLKSAHRPIFDPGITYGTLAPGNTPGALPNEDPIAAFTFVSMFLDVTFDASGSSDPDGTIVSYDWDYNDGNIDTGVNPTHTYAVAGTYLVTLVVTDNQGATDMIQHSVEVQGGLIAEWDASVTSSVHTTGGFVDQIDDLIGVCHLVAAGTVRPAYGTRTLNGLDVMAFDNVNDELDGPDQLDIGTNSMLVCVVADIDFDAGNSVLIGKYGGPLSQGEWFLRVSMNAVNSSYHDGTDRTVISPNVATQGPRLHTFVVNRQSTGVNGQTMRVRQNGRTFYSNAWTEATPPSLDTGESFRVGEALAGGWAHARVYLRPFDFTDADIELVENEMMTKWGIEEEAPLTSALSAAILGLNPLSYWPLSGNDWGTLTDHGSLGNDLEFTDIKPLLAKLGGDGLMYAGGSGGNGMEVPDDINYETPTASGLTVFAMVYEDPSGVGSTRMINKIDQNGDGSWSINWSDAVNGGSATTLNASDALARRRRFTATGGIWQTFAIRFPASTTAFPDVRIDGVNGTGSTDGTSTTRSDSTQPFHLFSHGGSVGAFSGWLGHVAVFAGVLSDGQCATLEAAAAADGW